MAGSLNALLGAAVPEATTSQVARSLGMAKQTVKDLLARQQPVADTLRQLQRDVLLGGVQWLYLDTLKQAQEDQANDQLSYNDRRQVAITLAVCVDKALLLSGQPTAIVAGVHAHRHELGAVADKLAAVARALDGPRRELALPLNVPNSEDLISSEYSRP